MRLDDNCKLTLKLIEVNFLGLKCSVSRLVVAGSVQVLNQLLTAVLVGPVQGVSSFLL